MEIRELRIGNYIEYNGEIIKLDGSLLCCYIQNELDYPFNEVPLTEEILLKFGFSSRGTFWLDLYLDEKTKFTLGWHPDGRIDFEISINKIYFDISHIKHIHQLQNLYFTLTGEELTFKNHLIFVKK